MIPRVFHQIWLGPNPLPDEWAALVETWKAHHPAWEHRLWTETNLPAGLRPEVYERLRVPAERSDILRLELLRRFGGVYIDTDFECLRPLDPLLDGVHLFAAYYKADAVTNEKRVNNAIIGATAEHPLILRALREIRPRSTWGTVDKEGTGPFFLNRLLRDADATIFDRRLFYPSPAERSEAVAYHHMARTWKDEKGLRRSATLAHSRTARARAELAQVEYEHRQLTRVVERLEERAEDTSGSGRTNVGIAVVGDELAGRLDAVAHRIRQRSRYARLRNRRRAARATEIVRDALTPRIAGVRGRLNARRAAEICVPRVFHHIWLADSPIDSAAARRRTTWKLLHPDWAFRLWTEADLPVDLVRPEVYDRLRSPAERADILRLELLARYGGVVVDFDLSCRRRIDGLIAGLDCFAAADGRGSPSTALVGSVPGHPFLSRAAAEIRPIAWHGYADEATGSGALARGAASGAGLELLPAAAFVPTAARTSNAVYGTFERAAATAAERQRLNASMLEAERVQQEAESLLERRRNELSRLAARRDELVRCAGNAHARGD